jgi:hypothetical protein
VQHHERGAFAAVEVVDAYAIDIDEAAERRIGTLGEPRALVDECRQRARRRRPMSGFSLA